MFKTLFWNFISQLDKVRWEIEIFANKNNTRDKSTGNNKDSCGHFVRKRLLEKLLKISSRGHWRFPRKRSRELLRNFSSILKEAIFNGTGNEARVMYFCTHCGIMFFVFVCEI